MQRSLLLVVLVIAGSAGIAGVAFAVSDGNYGSDRQSCTGRANNSDRPSSVEDSCQNFAVVLDDGQGTEQGRAGLRQTPDGTLVDPRPQLSVTPQRGSGNTRRAYLGADDNLDKGEHDSSEGVNNGPSDGGALQLNFAPDTLTRWSAAVAGGDLAYLLTHPTPLVDAGGGMCADGICSSLQTQRRVAFQGGNDKTHRDVANYDGKQWDPESCAGPTDKPKDCGGKPLKFWSDKEGTVYVQPGLQFYEDPDPQGSPVGPYPLPAAYAGTCGVVLGGGVAPKLPPTPVTNKAGQVVVKTGCG